MEGDTRKRSRVGAVSAGLGPHSNGSGRCERRPLRRGPVPSLLLCAQPLSTSSRGQGHERRPRLLLPMPRPASRPSVLCTSGSQCCALSRMWVPSSVRSHQPGRRCGGVSRPCPLLRSGAPPPPSTSDKVSVTTTPGSSRVRPPPSWQSSEQAWSGPPEAGRGRKDPWTEEAAGFGLQRVPDTPGRVESPGASCADSKPPLVVPGLLWHFCKPSTMSKGKRQNKDVSVGFSSEVSSFLLSLLTCSFPPCPPEDLETVGLSV